LKKSAIKKGPEREKCKGINGSIGKVSIKLSSPRAIIPQWNKEW